MLVKHVAAAGMAAIGALSQAVVQPALARAQLQLRRSRPEPDDDKTTSAERRETQLLWLNLACALVVLICTAVATSQ